jgi:N-formylglutamate amidohydrolase
MYERAAAPFATPADARAAVLNDRPLDLPSRSEACRVRVVPPLTRPLLATALHAGVALPPEIAANLSACAATRRYEEDPWTDTFVADLPLTIVAQHSRFAYDLNRVPERAVARTREEVWGLDLWRTPPDDAQLRVAHGLYHEVYALLDAVVEALTERFGVALVFDCHSYNGDRHTPLPGRTWFPLFDVGTAGADRAHHGAVIDDWLGRLRAIRIPGIETTVGENAVYDGRGGLVRHVGARHPGALVLPTEVRKAYMDERSLAPYPDRVEALRRQLAPAALATAGVLLEVHARRR